MSARDEETAAEIAEAERIRVEGVAEYERLGIPSASPLRLSERERAEANAALREFEDRRARGEWYGEED